MPSGERSQVWYPELVSVLRTEWRSDPSWEAVMDLRARLQQHLEDLRARRGITPPLIRCPHCGAIGPAAAPVISVRAMLLALVRYKIEPLEFVRQRERAWARYRVAHGLDVIGRRTGDVRSPESQQIPGRRCCERPAQSEGAG